MADDALTRLLRQTGLEPRAGLEAELADRLRAAGAERAGPAPAPAAASVGGPGADGTALGAPAALVPEPPAGRPRRAPARALVAAAVVAVLAAGAVAIAALGRGDTGDLVTVDSLPAPTTSAEPATTTSAPGPTTPPTTSGPVALRAVLAGSALQVGVPAGWAHGATSTCPPPRTVAWFEEAAAAVGRCDGAPGPWVILEPLPADLGAMATTCQPAPLADGTVACEATTAGGQLRRVLVNGEDVLVTAHTPADPDVAATLRGLSRPAAPAGGESAEPPSVGATAAVQVALAPLLADGCAAAAPSLPPDVVAACSALGLDAGGAALQGARFVPATAEAAGPSTYLVDLVLADGSLRSAEVQVTYTWDRDARSGQWRVTALRPL